MKIKVTCEGTAPLILHRYSLEELLALWNLALPLRDECDRLPYYDDRNRVVIPRAILQANLTRAARTIGLELTPKRRLIPGLRILDRSCPIFWRDKKEAYMAIAVRAGNGSRTFAKLEGISFVLPRHDRWRFCCTVELGEDFGWRLARRIWNAAGRLGIGDSTPRLGTYIVQQWERTSHRRAPSIRQRLSG